MAKNYAIESISSLPFGMLIGAPLSAAIEAQAQAAKATIDFILTVGFLPPTLPVGATQAQLANPDPVDITKADSQPVTAGGFTPDAVTNAGQTRMVTFSYATKTVDPTDPTKTIDSNATITVPLLSVVPIPFLQIDEMTIDFVAKITEVITANSKASSASVKAASTQASGGWGPISAGLKGSISSTHTSTSERSSKYQTELTMTIHVRASSESMPKGMGKVLDMLASLIKQS